MARASCPWSIDRRPRWRGSTRRCSTGKIEGTSAGDRNLSFVMGPLGPLAGFTEPAEGDDRIPMWIPTSASTTTRRRPSGGTHSRDASLRGTGLI